MKNKNFVSTLDPFEDRIEKKKKTTRIDVENNNNKKERKPLPFFFSKVRNSPFRANSCISKKKAVERGEGDLMARRSRVIIRFHRLTCPLLPA